MITSRYLLAVTIMILSLLSSMPVLANTQYLKPISLKKELAELEASFDGQIGLYAINTSNNQHLQYRALTRFPMQSTFKLMVVSAILKQSMSDKNLLPEKINYSKADIVYWSPITEKHFLQGMTIFELCAAAMIYSDSTATNLLVKKLGGPSAVNAFARSIGDSTFRIDGWEPDLNSNSNDVADSTTPYAMEMDLEKLLLGNVLAPAQREQLLLWMKANTTGDARIRAGVPSGWLVADKTGASTDYGISNDLGLIWPPNSPPIILIIYSIQNKKAVERRDELVAAATRLVLRAFKLT